jgi:NOL1/NOP2/sun family putative RNA methylase
MTPDRYFSRYRGIIPDYPGFLEALHAPLPQHVRVNRLKTSPGTVVARAAEEGVRLTRSHPTDDTLFTAAGAKTPGNLTAYFLGHLHPQALTSCIASRVLSPGPGALVLDMCAAPGGKTAHAADLMGNRGLIVANDLHTGRHPALAHNLARLGVLNAVITAYQAQQFPQRQRFGWVLADVPCTGEGGFRAVKGRSEPIRGPRAHDLPGLQKRILERGFDLLEPGGILVYATCTYDPRENEAVVDHLLRRREAVVLPLSTELPSDPGLTAWNKERFDDRLAGTRRFYPHRVDSVGFYLARIGRSG